MSAEIGQPRPSFCVVLGAPRSGTTWLQRVLAMSPSVVTPQETHLFRAYLDPQRAQWDAHGRRVAAALARLDEGEAAAHRIFGLPTLLEKQDLIESQRLLLSSLQQRALSTKPGASWVLEKSPSNSLCVDLIEELDPTVRYVHIVRDPGDVVASLRAAGRSWAPWAPTDAASAARMWLRHVEGARQASTVAPDRYVEVRYERMRQDPVGSLEPVLALLGLDDDPRVLVEQEGQLAGGHGVRVFALRSELVTRLEEHADTEPAGFRRRSAQREGLGFLDRRIVAAEVGELASSLGYPSSGQKGRPVTRSLWAAAAAGQGRFGAARRWLRRQRTDGSGRRG